MNPCWSKLGAKTAPDMCDSLFVCPVHTRLDRGPTLTTPQEALDRNDQLEGEQADYIKNSKREYLSHEEAVHTCDASINTRTLFTHER